MIQMVTKNKQKSNIVAQFLAKLNNNEPSLSEKIHIQHEKIRQILHR